MKTHIPAIGLLLLLTLSACTPPKASPPAVETQNLASQNTVFQDLASPELSAIDSLLWACPDSALMCLVSCFDTLGDAESGVSTAKAEYNRHYAHLLLAELLFKNYQPQLNRHELQRAVDYFDSLLIANTRSASANNAPPTTVFLNARAHYINGAGYDENDSVVEACAEYLRALKIMETRFPFVETQNFASLPIPHIPRFMALIYNRLGSLFSEQYMMKPSITCYEKALAFCLIEPTSTYGIPSLYYHIGKQYDKMDEFEKAKEYFDQAIEKLPNTNNSIYRDIISSRALCDYQLGAETALPLKTLYQTLNQAEDESERITRCLSIGAIYFEEKMYDSALVYLEPVYKSKKDRELHQFLATKYLRIIYDSLGNNEKSDECMREVSQQIKLEAENKVLVSRLNSLFQNYTDDKHLEQQQITRHKKLRLIAVISTILILSAFATWLLYRRKIKQRDKTIQQMETKQQAHQMEQAALAGRLKRSNQEVRELKGQIRQQKDDTNSGNGQAATLDDEPVYRLIMERVNDGHFKSQMDCSIYKDYALSKEQLSALREAVNRHFNRFTTRLVESYPLLTSGDLNYCCLYLLDLNDADIAALMQRAYSTVSDRSRKLKAIFGSTEPLSITLHRFASEETTF